MDFAEYSGPLPFRGFSALSSRLSESRRSARRTRPPSQPRPPLLLPGNQRPGNSAGGPVSRICPAPSTMSCSPSPCFLWVIQATCFWCCGPKVSAFRPAARPCSDWCSTSPIRCFPGPREISATAFPAARLPPPGIWYSRPCISSLPSRLQELRSGLRWHPMACSTH